MGNLSNLYISQSYQSLIHLGNDSVVSSSLVELQDGLGNSIGVAVDSAGDLSISGSFTSSLQQGYVWVGNSNGKTTTIPTSSLSGGSSISALNVFTASQETKNNTLATYTGSVDTKFNTLGTQSGSWITESETGSFAKTDAVNTFTLTNNFQEGINIDGQSTFADGQILDTISVENITGSLVFNKIATASKVDLQNLSLLVSGSLTASLQQGYAWVGGSGNKSIAVPTSSFGGTTDLSSLNAFTASQETKNNTLGGVTASLQQQLTNIGSQSGSWVTESETGSFARTDVSNTFTTSQTIQGGLNVTGTITANEIHTIIESSSVIFSSGSNILGDAATDTQTLNGSVNVVNQLTASGLHYPTADNGALSFIQTDGAGNLSLQYVKTLYQNIRNMETSSIVLGTPLFVSGATGDNANVYIAQASNPLRYPATLIAGDSTLAPSATGKAIVSGEIKGPDTSLYTPGTVIYLGGNGGWTATRPTGSSTQVQILGVVTKQGNNGEGLVMNQLGTELPNIQQGYTWVGNVDGTPTAVATSSFGGTTDITALNAFTSSQETKNNTLGIYTSSVDTQLINLSTSQSIDNQKWINISSQSGSWGGGSINTGSFATTGSNTFDGSQNINGAVTASNGIRTNGSIDVLGGSGISIKANIEGSGSAYGGITTIVDVDTDPTNVYSAYQLIKPNGDSLISIAANSYTPQYTGITIPMLFGGGNNPDGNNAGIAFPTDGTADVWKKSNFKYGVSVTGSTELQNFTASLQQGYAFVGAANGKTTTVPTSSFGGGGTPTDITALNAFTASQETKNSTLASYTGSVNTQLTNLSTSQSIDDQKWINISTQSGSWGGGGSINTGSFATTGSNVFDGNQIITNGGLSIQSNAQGSGSAYAIGGGIVDIVSDPTNVYSAWQLVEPSGNNLISIAVNSYTGEYPSTPIPILFGGGNNPSASNAGIAFPSNGQADHWKKSNFKFGVDVTGSLKVTSTLTASLQEGYVWAGGAGNVSKLVATSSFSGGGGSTFPYSGTASISGSLQVTGSMSGLPNELTVSSNTASIDFTKGNFFSITLPASATTRFEVANTIKGQTINIQINQPAGASTGSVAFSPSILFAGGNDYQATATGSAIDLLTLVAITGSSVLATSIKNFQ